VVQGQDLPLSIFELITAVDKIPTYRLLLTVLKTKKNVFKERLKLSTPIFVSRKSSG